MTGDRLKLLRKTIGLTQEQLAQRLGIGKAALSMIETGKAAFPMPNR
jgi:transcriptional regulator with XRE-family HTH domain